MIYISFINIKITGKTLRLFISIRMIIKILMNIREVKELFKYDKKNIIIITNNNLYAQNNYVYKEYNN